MEAETTNWFIEIINWMKNNPSGWIIPIVASIIGAVFGVFVQAIFEFTGRFKFSSKIVNKYKVTKEDKSKNIQKQKVKDNIGDPMTANAKGDIGSMESEKTNQEVTVIDSPGARVNVSKNDNDPSVGKEEEALGMPVINTLSEEQDFICEETQNISQQNHKHYNIRDDYSRAVEYYVKKKYSNATELYMRNFSKLNECFKSHNFSTDEKKERKDFEDSLKKLESLSDGESDLSPKEVFNGIEWAAKKLLRKI